MSKLTHLDDEGNLSMVDVGAKAVTRREAVAEAIVRFSSETFARVRDGNAPKGNIFSTAKIAGILAAKATPALIPLTHPLPLDFIDVECIPEESSIIRVIATARCEARTGVEIEAMTAASIAALTIYDMCKSLDHSIVIEKVRLLSKGGGKSGCFAAPQG